MNAFLSGGWLMAAALVFSGVQAQAAEEGFAANPERRKKILERFDKDGDGQLNEAERAAAKEARMALRGKRGGAAGPNPRAMLERFDKDGDGELSPIERQAMAEMMKERLGEKGAGELRERMKKQMDTDGDGVMSKQEMKAAREKRQQMAAQENAEKNAANKPQGAPPPLYLDEAEKERVRF